MIAKSLDSQFTVTLSYQLQFRYLRIFITNSSFETVFAKILI